MQIYTPFLKFKQNEVGALVQFARDRNDTVVPFFDLPRPKEQDEESIVKRIELATAQAERHLSKSTFYVDNYDLDDSIVLKGHPQYQFILGALGHLDVIPVAALNRDPHHNQAATDFVSEYGSKIALRLVQDDFTSYALTKPRIQALWKDILSAKPNAIHLIIDFRVISENIDTLRARAAKFVTAFCADFHVDKIIFTGSSIPAVVTDVVTTNSQVHVERDEWNLWNILYASLEWELKKKSCYGDYGVVSPDYSDLEIEAWMMQNIATPKVFYTHSTKFFVVRGGAFKQNGYGQYYQMADAISGQKFFRGAPYSAGDRYIHDRSKHALVLAKSSGSPGSWVKATLNAHITFVVDNL